MRHLTLLLLTIFAVTSTAAAEPRNDAKPVKIKKVQVRAYNAASPEIACSNHHQTTGISCEGIERYRSGMGSTQTTVDVGMKGASAVVMYQVVSKPAGGLVWSQAIAAVGVRKMIGRGWIQGGPGIARIGVGPGPRSIGTSKTVDQPRPALAGGVGMNLSKAEDPATLAIDFGTTIDSKDDEPQVYQIGASVVRKF